MKRLLSSLKTKPKEELIIELLATKKEIKNLEDLLTKLRNKAPSSAGSLDLEGIKTKITKKKQKLAIMPRAITPPPLINPFSFSQEPFSFSQEPFSFSQEPFSFSPSRERKRSQSVASKNSSGARSVASDIEIEFLERDIKNLEKLKKKQVKVEKLQKDNEELLKQKELFEEQEIEIKYLEARVQELIDLIKQQKNKIMSAFLRLLPERELLHELIKTHLELTRFKKQEMDATSYGKKCREYKRKCQKIEDKLADKLDETTMNEIQRILTDCEELMNQELELEAKLNNKSSLIEEQKQTLQITNSMRKKKNPLQLKEEDFLYH